MRVTTSWMIEVWILRVLLFRFVVMGGWICIQRSDEGQLCSQFLIPESVTSPGGCFGFGPTSRIHIFPHQSTKTCVVACETHEIRQQSSNKQTVFRSFHENHINSARLKILVRTSQAHKKGKVESNVDWCCYWCLLDAFWCCLMEYHWSSRGVRLTKFLLSWRGIRKQVGSSVEMGVRDPTGRQMFEKDRRLRQWPQQHLLSGRRIKTDRIPKGMC